jgi:hypothetical protein
MPDGIFKKKTALDCAVGSGRKCKPMGSSRSSTPITEKWSIGKMPRVSKKEEKENEAEYERIMSARKPRPDAVFHPEFDTEEEVPTKLKSGYKLRQLGVQGNPSVAKSTSKK